MANVNVTPSRAIRLEKQTTTIAGRSFPIDAHFSAAELAQIFGLDAPIPIPVTPQGTAPVRHVARYLRRIGIAGLRAMRDGSSISPGF